MLTPVSLLQARALCVGMRHYKSPKTDEVSAVCDRVRIERVERNMRTLHFFAE